MVVTGVTSKTLTRRSAVSKILIVPDLHLPFADMAAVRQVISFSKKFKPDVIVQLGDLYDQYSFSKYRRTLELTSPSEEISLGRKLAGKMWEALRATAKKASCFQLFGNHDSRLIKRVMDKLPELESIVEEPVKDLYTFKGVETKFDERDYVEIEGILFMHGFMCGLGKHLKQFNQNVVVGHSHQGGTIFEKHKDKIIFELNAGHLADVKQLPLCYMPTKISKSTVGFGVIEDGVPSFRPLE
jgi:predicted phosphodiesterase